MNKKFNQQKILIIEDDDVSLLYLERLLENWQLTPVKATTGKEAVKAFEEHDDIKLILMDIKLPEYSGLELTKKFKSKRKDIPIIAQTAYAMLEDKERCNQAGCDNVITKPIDEDQLFNLLLRYIS